MAWFWTKKKPANTNSNAAVDAHGSTGVVTPAAPDAQAAVDAAVASAQQSDKEWRRQAARLREEEKRREKEREREAKQQLAEMKKQARAARKERARAEKLAEKQAKTVLKVHRRQQKADRQRVKAMAKMLHAAEKRRKRLLRKRQKEERRRRKQVRAQDARAPEPELVVAETPALDRGATTTPLQAPVFKEDKCCNACHSQFKRLPTRRRHHCRNCGESFCSKCLSGVKRPIPWFKLDKPQKVCFSCDVQVFNGMGGAARPNRSERSNTAASSLSSSSTAPVSTRVEAAQVPPEPEQRSRSPLRAERSASFQSEQPQDESPRTTSPPLSRSGLSFRLRPRSRRDGNSSKSKKNSLWTLPIRPLLKRKASADQLRNRTWDLDLRIAKEAMLARQRQSQMIVVTGAPQFAMAS